MPYCPDCDSDNVDWRPGRAWCLECEWEGSPYDLNDAKRLYVDPDDAGN